MAKGKPHLHVVAGGKREVNFDDYAYVLGPDPAEPAGATADAPEPPGTTTAKRGRKTRMPPIEGLFAPTTLERLYDRQYHKVYPPLTRLYLFIVAQSYRGTQPFELTNAMAAKLGINRHHKSEYLGMLERHGVVAVIRDGQATVIVSATG